MIDKKKLIGTMLFCISDHCEILELKIISKREITLDLTRIETELLNPNDCNNFQHEEYFKTMYINKMNRIDTLNVFTDIKEAKKKAAIFINLISIASSL